jgi:hypothetical protein
MVFLKQMGTRPRSFTVQENWPALERTGAVLHLLYQHFLVVLFARPLSPLCGDALGRGAAQCGREHPCHVTMIE